jgi:hypothetical protein
MMPRYRFGAGEHMKNLLPILVLIEGLCPSISPTPSLARAFRARIRSGGSLAALTRWR